MHANPFTVLVKEPKISGGSWQWLVLIGDELQEFGLAPTVEQAKSDALNELAELCDDTMKAIWEERNDDAS